MRARVPSHHHAGRRPPWGSLLRLFECVGGGVCGVCAGVCVWVVLVVVGGGMARPWWWWCPFHQSMAHTQQ